ncbi:MAG: hypothetical protein IPN70_01005 [Candidatus Moraniibacteriota bacterium]|nr:MAG: hypothetical protein IPN70_01005 [Candidatus Moranbacteria bacterium]
MESQNENQGQTVENFSFSDGNATQESQEGKKPFFVAQGIPAEIPTRESGNIYGIFSLICAALSLLSFPILLGPIGIFLGSLARKRNKKTLGLIGMILSVIGMITGFIFGVVIANLQEKGLLSGSISAIF